MSGNKHVIKSDLAKSDAHVITPDEYEELPEMTDADFELGVWKVGDRQVSPEKGMAAFRQALMRFYPTSMSKGNNTF